MLSPSEFHVGDLANAPATGLTLFKPRREGEVPMLFAAGPRMTILLGGRFPFHAFEFKESEAHRWTGLLIPGVSIEVDDTSVFDAGNSRAPVGCLVRRNTSLACVVNMEDRSFIRSEKIDVMDGLVACAQHEAAGFPKWRIVLGEREEKRVLLEIDLLAKKTEPAES